MKKLALTLLAATPLALSAVAVAPAVAQSGTASDLNAVQAHLKAVDSMTADFIQTDRSNQRLTGTMTMKRPGKIRFQYQKGVPMLIVSDGKALTLIDYEVKQVERWPISNSPLGILLNPNMDMSQYGKVIPTGDPRVVSVEVRDKKRPEYGTITMVFIRDSGSPGGLKLSGWVAMDAQNKRTSIKLSNQKFNVPVASNAFAWTDPRPSKRK